MQEVKCSLNQDTGEEKVLLAPALCGGFVQHQLLLLGHFSSADNWHPFRGRLSSLDFNTALLFLGLL